MRQGPAGGPPPPACPAVCRASRVFLGRLFFFRGAYLKSRRDEAPLLRPSAAQVPLWGACGGLSSTPAEQNAADPAYCCASDSTCSYVNEWYWQCVPTGSGGPGTSSGNAAVGHWSQCGGKSGCPSGASCGDNQWATCGTDAGCVRSDEWYWQCLPGGGGGGSPNSNATPSGGCTIQVGKPHTHARTHARQR